jgi:hypothetical protein
MLVIVFCWEARRIQSLYKKKRRADILLCAVLLVHKNSIKEMCTSYITQFVIPLWKLYAIKRKYEGFTFFD